MVNNLEILFFPDGETVNRAIAADDPLLVLIAHDESRIIIANIDDCGEHIILLRLAGFSDGDLDKYYRIVLNRDGADWTFVCPSGYKNIANTDYRIKQFYGDGIAVITKGLERLNYNVEINIPKRYRRHFTMLDE